MKILKGFVFFVLLIASCKSPEPVKQKESTDYPALPEAISKAEYRGLGGKTIKLEDYKGKVVLVNLWATWCSPCRDEMPHLVELQDKYKGNGFEIIGLNVEQEDTEAKVQRFAEQMHLNYTLGWVDDQGKREFVKISRFDAIPQSFLINRKGQIVGVFLGGGGRTIVEMKSVVKKVVEDTE
jgi:thiol-disulfide isomerase/thioredoxin